MAGVFPSVLKTAKAVCVFKKDSKFDCRNYCPISLLSDIEKILEKPIYKRLYNFLKNNNIIYNLQFGFKQQYSTSHALVNITENIRKALDDGNIGCGVSLRHLKYWVGVQRGQSYLMGRRCLFSLGWPPF